MAGRYPSVASARAFEMGENAIASMDEMAEFAHIGESFAARLQRHLIVGRQEAQAALLDVERIRPHVGTLEVDRLETLEQRLLRGMAEDELMSRHVTREFEHVIEAGRVGMQAQLDALRAMGHPQLVAELELAAKTAIAELAKRRAAGGSSSAALQRTEGA